MTLFKTAVLSAASVLFVSTAHAQDGPGIFTGDTRYACEAILCLSSGQRPDECTPSLRRFFSIRRASDRRDFLRGCPQAEEDSQRMGQYTDLLADAAYRCQADVLNVQHVYYQSDNGPYIHNTLPAICRTYAAHPNTDQISIPVYRGEPEDGGRWVSR